MTCADEIWTGARPLPAIVPFGAFFACSIDDAAGRFCDTEAEGAMVKTGSSVMVRVGGQERVLRWGNLIRHTLP